MTDGVLTGLRVVDFSSGPAGGLATTVLADFGADVIKADPTDDVSQYHKVIETASGIPVLVRGGGRVSDKEILVRTEGLLKQGASGIVYGRNVIQHPNPRGITQALMAMVHRNASVDEALKLI